VHRTITIALAACGATTPPLAPIDRAAEIAQLGSPDQAVRDAAAAHLRAHPASEHDEVYWKGQLAARAKPGMTSAQFAAEFHATSEGAASSGGSTTTIWRLDDQWTVQIFSDEPDSLREVGPVERSVRAVWVDPPKDFTGRWITYYVDGHIDNDFTYNHSVYAQQSTYYDNGQLVMTRHYVAGKLEGPERAFHDNGRVAYEGQYAGNNMVGHWVHWYPDGKIETEQSYDADGKLDGSSTTYRPDGSKQVTFEYSHGVETGQAGWDEHGILEYAHGSAEHH
jgi:hypothetical protein